MIYVPPPFAAAAIDEAVDADLDLVICITEGIPVRDMIRTKHRMKGKRTLLVGPELPRRDHARRDQDRHHAGPHPQEGPVGVVSRSGTLTYEAVGQLTELGLGQSSCVGIGGDPVNGLKHIDVLSMFNDDPQTEAVIMVGEIGGSDEENAARWVKDNMKKPVVGFIAGITAPPGKRMGHAGAIISGGKGTAQEKLAVMEACGIKVTRNPAEMGRTLKPALKKRGSRGPPRPNPPSLLPYAATIFLSSFLLFLVQPIIAKQILPWFGGSAAVWTTCLVFFQSVLLAGYAYADWTTRLGARRQAMLHVALLAVSLALPADPRLERLEAAGRRAADRAHPAAARRDHRPAVLPAVDHHAAAAGVVLAPLPYRGAVPPVRALQPRFAACASRLPGAVRAGVRPQGARLGLVVPSSRGSRSSAPHGLAFHERLRCSEAQEPSQRQPLPARTQLQWLALAAMGSVMLLAVTNHITQNISSVPFLWVLPLALYLVSFILAFDHPRWYIRPRCSSARWWCSCR